MSRSLGRASGRRSEENEETTRKPVHIKLVLVGTPRPYPTTWSLMTMPRRVQCRQVEHRRSLRKQQFSREPRRDYWRYAYNVDVLPCSRGRSQPRTYERSCISQTGRQSSLRSGTRPAKKIRLFLLFYYELLTIAHGSVAWRQCTTAGRRRQSSCMTRQTMTRL